MDLELSIVLPAFNEGKHLEQTIASLSTALEDERISYELIVVDNGSSDDTRTVIERFAARDERVRCVVLDVNQGKGGGVLTGLGVARGAVVGWVDADGQADPRDILRVYRALEGGCALAMPIRVARDDGPWRRFLSRACNGLVRVLFFLPYRDINAPPKFLTRAAYEELGLVQRDWFLEAECVIKAARLGLSVIQVEVTWSARRGGASKVHLMTSLGYLKNVVSYRLGIM